MADEIKFHEQQEGWTHEALPDGHSVCIQRPSEIGGGFVKWTHWSRQFFSGFKLYPFPSLQLVGAAP